MSENSNNPHQLAFVSTCVPGSVAEQQETERLAEFMRCKALRLAQEARDEPAALAARLEAHLAGCEETQQRQRRKRQGYSTYEKR